MCYVENLKRFLYFICNCKTQCKLHTHLFDMQALQSKLTNAKQKIQLLPI